jgi:hypothetical protein
MANHKDRFDLILAGSLDSRLPALISVRCLISEWKDFHLFYAQGCTVSSRPGAFIRWIRSHSRHVYYRPRVAQHPSICASYCPRWETQRSVQGRSGGGHLRIMVVPPKRQLSGPSAWICLLRLGCSLMLTFTQSVCMYLPMELRWSMSDFCSAMLLPSE